MCCKQTCPQYLYACSEFSKITKYDIYSLCDNHCKAVAEFPWSIELSGKHCEIYTVAQANNLMVLKQSAG